jgi:hypothetical protein
VNLLRVSLLAQAFVFALLNSSQRGIIRCKPIGAPTSPCWKPCPHPRWEARLAPRDVPRGALRPASLSSPLRLPSDSCPHSPINGLLENRTAGNGWMNGDTETARHRRMRWSWAWGCISVKVLTGTSGEPAQPIRAEGRVRFREGSSAHTAGSSAHRPPPELFQPTQLGPSRSPSLRRRGAWPGLEPRGPLVPPPPESSEPASGRAASCLSRTHSP